MDIRVKLFILWCGFLQIRARIINSPESVEMKDSDLVDSSANQVDSGPGRVVPISTADLLSDVRTVYRIYEECSKQDLSSCFKSKIVLGIERLSERPELVITEGISFVKDAQPGVSPDSRTGLTVDDLDKTLPRSSDDRHILLDQLIVRRIADFFTSHSLKIKIPTLEKIFSNDEEGRGKKNKYGSLLMMPFVMGGMMIPLAFGALALLAGKALIISKLALALAAIIGMKKLVGGGGSSHSSYEVLAHTGPNYRRSFTEEDLAAAAASNLAYRAYIPLSSETTSPTVSATLIKTS